MLTTKCLSVTKTELGGIIKGYFKRKDHRFGGLKYASKLDRFRVIDMDDDSTTIDDILKDAFGVNGYAGYSTKIFPELITVFYSI